MFITAKIVFIFTSLSAVQIYDFHIFTAIETNLILPLKQLDFLEGKFRWDRHLRCKHDNFLNATRTVKQNVLVRFLHEPIHIKLIVSSASEQRFILCHVTKHRHAICSKNKKKQNKKTKKKREGLLIQKKWLSIKENVNNGKDVFKWSGSERTWNFFFQNFPGKRASVNSNKNKPARAGNVRNHVAFLILHLIGWEGGPSSLDQSQTEVIKAKPM